MPDLGPSVSSESAFFDSDAYGEITVVIEGKDDLTAKCKVGGSELSDGAFKPTEWALVRVRKTWIHNEVLEDTEVSVRKSALIKEVRTMRVCTVLFFCASFVFLLFNYMADGDGESQ